MEVTHTLLHEMNLVKHFWADVDLITCYFINHMPIRILQNKSPIYILFALEWALDKWENGCGDDDDDGMK